MNEKVNKVCDVIIKIIGIVQILAQAVKSVFPVSAPVETKSLNSANLSQEEAHIVRDFYSQGVK